ncbi:uncharacterized protein LOC129369293 [Poeciliopsis prolifica]|uniref:uncharacterized protein LOC129369293 n=1 Tax=Poeciliopsis prolifica TaxID=188132 RepID=UPI002413B6E5|nr:uncharacterized protein LOC129369293 [Poeciliopsis prolifica]
MASCLKTLTILVLVVTVLILETRNHNFQFYFPALGYLVEEGEHVLPHIRQERSVLSDPNIYSANILLNASNVETYEQLLSTLNVTSYPLQLDNTTEIQNITVTTVCVSTETGFRCECEEQFAWPYRTCITYGACDSVSSGVCKCVSAIPADGSSCQLISELLVQTEYVIDLELNLTDTATVDFLRRLLSNGSNFLTLSPTVNVTQLDVSTVCSPISGDYQCRCEDQYRWPCDQCVTYGSCDNITGDTCGCISGIPADGQYCQAEDQYNFTSCPASTRAPELLVQTEYVIDLELNLTDTATVDFLRRLLSNGSNFLTLSPTVNVTQLDVSTVCSPISGDYQCRCEDQYRWPCDQCVTYGSCDNITGDTCGCISGIPADGQYCQAEDQYNFTACLTTTPLTPTTPPVIYQYMLYVELNSTDVTAVEKLRNINNTISINRNFRISDVNITTVCSPISGDYQCRCEDQYRWPCDQCVTYGSCDNITGDTCGCISGIPADGQYCQAVDQYNFTSCPAPTLIPSPHPLYEYVIDIELKAADDDVVAELRNITYPVSINSNIQISDVNISTVCSPISGDYQCRCEDQYRWPCDKCVTYGSCDNITGDTCGCISGIPADGQYCQAEDQYNFTACPITTTTPQPTSPPFFHQYLLSIELNSTDVTAVEKLRNINNTISINRNFRISDVNITTVCSTISGDYQCRCEDQYRWPCDQCVTYGSCDNITGDTCGCINGIPADGQYCQAVDQYNFTACPITTTTPQPTSPPFFHQYLLSIELNSTDVTSVEKLRNINNTISINRNFRISDVNITTVCSPISGGYQCRCEDQYRWPCDQCVTYGSCDNITGDTCGCVNGIPADGQYCQAVDQYNFTACPITTTTPQPTSPPFFHQYLLSIELNSTDVTSVEKLRNINNSISINRNFRISDVNITTVCSPISGDYQCRCEDQYRWPCDQCVTYGSCDNITGDTCGCISGIPADGQYCQAEDQYNFTACPITTTTPQPTSPPFFHQYLLSIELNSTDVTAVEKLRNINNSISINRNFRISDVNITTVCSPISGDYQCRCEDQYRWPCDQCVTYGSCDNITGDTCGCISGIPADGQYCQAEDQYNFTACPITTTTPQPTSPPVFHQYLLSIELNSTDVTAVEKLRNINNTISINRNFRISDVNITTVCSPISGDYQCRCEDQYRWPCDQCVTYGSCDNITGDTCGCINGIPADGQYCQAVDQYNFTACPITTTTPQPTSPPVFHQYLLSIELNSTDVTSVEKLRNINNTISINRNFRISDVNITTVCSPISGDYQCRCEDQYRWPCDQCVTYGSCDNITGDTCGCISGIPADGQYCQAEDQYNFTACPITTTTPQPTSPPFFHQLYSMPSNINNSDAINCNNNNNYYNTRYDDAEHYNTRNDDAEHYNTRNDDAEHYNTRNDDAEHYNTRNDDAKHYNTRNDDAKHYNTRNDDAKHYNTRNDNAKHYNTRNDDAEHYNTRNDDAEHYNTRNDDAKHYNTRNDDAKHYNTRNDNAKHYNTRNDDAEHYNTRNDDAEHYNTRNDNAKHYNTRNDDAEHYNTRNDDAEHYNTRNDDAGHYNTRNDDAEHYNTRNDDAEHYNTRNHDAEHYNTRNDDAKHYNTRNDDAGHYNTRNDDARHYNTRNNDAGHYNTSNDDAEHYNTRNNYGKYNNTRNDNAEHYNTRNDNAEHYNTRTNYGEYNITKNDNAEHYNTRNDDANTTTPGTTMLNTTTPGTTMPNTTTPGTTMPNTTTPGTTMPNTTTPGTTMPNTTTPGTTMLNTTTPGPTMANTTSPGTTMPNTTTPGTTMPNTTTPGTTMPNTTTPGTTMPDTTTPGTTMPDTTTPGTTMPDTTTPGTTMLNTTTPETTMANTTTPGTTMPNTTTPGTTMPNTTTPGTTMLNTTTPGMTMPNTTTPGTTMANTTPGTTMLNTTTPGTTMANTTPGTTMLNTTTPGTTMANTTPGTTMPNTTTPGTTMPNTTTPGTTMLNTTTPGTTMLNTTIPGTTMANTTTPGTTMPNTTTPGTTMLNTTTPGTTMANTTTPGTTMPNTTTPGTTMLNTTTPGTTMANTTPGTTMLNTTTPGRTMLNTTIPGTTMANTTTPGTTMLNTTTPGTTMANTTTPGTTMPNTTTPRTTMPNTTTPGTTMANTTPGTTMLNTTTPGTTMLNTTIPGTTMANTTTPGTTMPNTTTPGTTMLNTTTPGTTMPNTTTPGTTMANTTTPGTTMPNTTTSGTMMPNTTTPGTTIGTSMMPQNTTMTPTTPVLSTALTTTTSTTIIAPATNATTNPTILITTIRITNHTTAVLTTHQTKTTPFIPTRPINMTTAITKPQSTSAQPNTPAITVPTTTIASPTVPTTTVTLPPSPTPTGTVLEIKRSIRLDKPFIEDYKNKSSRAYIDLKEQFEGLLSQQYNIKIGVIAAFVTNIREGSVIVDFTVRTSEYNTQMAEANNELIKAIGKEIAPVLDGKVTEVQSDTPMTLQPDVIYTDETMTLTCAPPGFDLKVNFSVTWKFKGLVLSPSQRHKISSIHPFTLEIAQVIPSDAGTYECTSKGKDIIVYQNRNVLSSNIRSAPVISVSRTVLSQCDQGKSVPLTCCVQSPFKLKWYEGNTELQSDRTSNCITYQYIMGQCTEEKKATFICQVDDPKDYKKETFLTVFLGPIICNDAEYGEGRVNDRKERNCVEGQTGAKTAVCLASGTWELRKDTCIVTVIKDLLTESLDLKKEEVPEFTGNLTKAVNEKVQQVTQSPATISAIVDILNTIGSVSNNIEKDVMKNVLETVDVIISDDAKESWSFLNKNETQNSSSRLLFSMETLSERLNGSFTINTQRIQLKRTKFTNPFNEELNSTITIAIPETGFDNTFITTILFSSLNNVMPPRTPEFNLSLFNETSNETYPENVINGAVLLVKVNEVINNVTLSYQKLNTTLELNPQCVFWNFTLFDNLGAWDDQGCEFVSDINDTVTCTCNHLTSFSILMSTDIPEELRLLLDIMTYIGVGISMISLIICLIIEGIVWRPLTKNSTAFMRHVAIVNTALSLLIADICFIIGAAIAKNPKENPGEDYKVPVGPCSAATFFMHFFYLAMFFWMLDSSLLLLYRSVMVFSQMSKWTMFAIGLTVGYVCPLIIAVTTVAATAPGGGYVREDQACWLNWTKTKALLALVIPALAIVVFNILVILVVLYKMLRRRNTNQADEKNALLVILRCVAILTPLFGLTWCLGIGTMVDPTNGGIHVAFAFFNSLQGFFILVFGTLFDSKIRSLILRNVPALSTTSNRTRSTSGGTSALSSVFGRLRRGRNGYNVSQVGNSNTSSSGSESFANT